MILAAIIKKMVRNLRESCGLKKLWVNVVENGPLVLKKRDF